MATTNAESPCYVADTGLAVKTYMDIALSSTPYAPAERTVQEELCIPGDSNAGALQVNDFGTADSRRVLEFSVPYAEAATVAAINTLYLARAQVIVSFDDGGTKYTCSWQNGRSFEAVSIEGIGTVYALSFKFRVNSIA